MWKEGSIKVNGEDFSLLDEAVRQRLRVGHRRRTHFQAHVQAGRIHCLQLRQRLDIEPTDENTQLALELLLHSENW